jgi:hypothetical protein
MPLQGGKSMFDGFIQIQGIAGESTDGKHPGWIEIIDFDLGGHRLEPGEKLQGIGRILWAPGIRYEEATACGVWHTSTWKAEPDARSSSITTTRRRPVRARMANCWPSRIPTHNNYRYNFELAVSRNKAALKQKLDEFSNQAFKDLTDGVKLKYESGQVTLQTPLAAYANAGPYIVRVAADAPNHFSGSFKTEPLSGMVEKDRRRFKYTAEVEFKIEVIWHPRPRSRPEPVAVRDLQDQSDKGSFQTAKNVGAFFVSVVLAIAAVYTGCVGMRSGAFRPGGMPMQPYGATSATPSMFLMYNIAPRHNA